MKKAIIVNYDLGRNSTYNAFCNTLKEILGCENIEVPVTNETVGDFLENFDVIIFPTIKILDQAQWVKRIFSEKTVILWTMISHEKPEENGIIIFQKGSFKDIKNMLEIIRGSPKTESTLPRKGIKL